MIGFVLLTFVLTWTAWAASLTGPIFLLGVFAPGLVALALTAYSGGRVGVERVLAPIGRWRVSAWLYVFAVLTMPVSKLLAALVHRISTGAWPGFGPVPVPLMLGAILVSTWVQAGEEVGWRGYMLPRLASRLGLRGASLLLGVVWAVWHLPLFFLHGSGGDGQSFPVYLLHVTALSVAMAWLYWKSGGSLLLVMLMHAAVNNTTGIVPAELPNAADPWSFHGSLVAWTTVGIAWALAFLLLVNMRGATLVMHDLTDFATRYAAAWSSRDPARLASFYAENGSLVVNGGPPATGRAAVAETAQSFMTAFPDMVVKLDRLDQQGDHPVFHWIWTGTNTGPGGTGRSVRMTGYEAWTMDPGGLIAKSDGHYDEAEYQRQLSQP